VTLHRACLRWRQLVATVVPFFFEVGWFIIFGFLGLKALIMGFKYLRPLARGHWVAGGRGPGPRRGARLAMSPECHRRLVWAQRQYCPGRHHRDDLAFKLLWAGIGPGWRQ
jgi:hypothetical protein